MSIMSLRLLAVAGERPFHYVREALVFPLFVTAGCVNDSEFS